MQSNQEHQVRCEPVSPVAPWLGGKRHLASRIVRRLSAVQHVAYVEPFIGMGGVFLRRDWRAHSEVINDISRDVATLFRVLQRHYQAFMDVLRWQITSRAEFDRLRTAVPDTLTDLERAARFLYLQRLAFGGKARGQNFGTTPAAPARFDVSKLAGLLEAVHERLSGVTIECLPWPELLDRYDRPDALFYLDPPYWGCENDYGDGIFARADFELLAERLAVLRGPWLLSLNDVPEVRRIFGCFTIDPVDTSYSVAGNSTPAREVLISNGTLKTASDTLFG